MRLVTDVKRYTKLIAEVEGTKQSLRKFVVPSDLVELVDVDWATLEDELRIGTARRAAVVAEKEDIAELKAELKFLSNET